MAPGPEDIDAAAGAWDARLRGAHASQEDRQAFQAWLYEDPAHGEAHDRLQRALRLLRTYADLPELSALRDEARNIVDAGKRRRIAGFASLAAGLAAALVLFLMMPFGNRDAGVLARLQGEALYATTRDESTKVTLADGSVVTLDTDTQMAVRLGEHRRDIELLRGRALFRVAKDATRPFVVRAGSRSITALGTVFDVRVSPRELRVTLAEGSVAVRSLAPGPEQAEILKPRQQLVAAAGDATPLLRTVDIDNVLAWADRQFFFEDEPLASAIDEINRHSDLKMVVDPAVAELRISGMFRISNQAGFIEALKMTVPVDVHRDADGRLVVTRAAVTNGV